MPIINVGLTQEEVLASKDPAPAGEYTLRLVEFLMDEKNIPQTEDAFVYLSKKGKPMLKVLFRIVSSDPLQDGKSIFFNAVMVKGREGFSFADLVAAFPNLMSGGTINTEAILGAECKADVEISEYQGRKNNSIARLKHLLS